MKSFKLSQIPIQKNEIPHHENQLNIELCPSNNQNMNKSTLPSRGIKNFEKLPELVKSFQITKIPDTNFKCVWHSFAFLERANAWIQDLYFNLEEKKSKYWFMLVSTIGSLGNLGVLGYKIWKTMDNLILLLTISLIIVSILFVLTFSSYCIVAFLKRNIITEKAKYAYFTAIAIHFQICLICGYNYTLKVDKLYGTLFMLTTYFADIILSSYITLYVLLTIFFIIFVGFEALVRCYTCKTEFSQNITQEFEYQRYIYEENVVSTDKCVICMSEFASKDAICLLKCHCEHIYHASCIAEWLNKRSTCPICRAPIIFVK